MENQFKAQLLADGLLGKEIPKKPDQHIPENLNIKDIEQFITLQRLKKLVYQSVLFHCIMLITSISLLTILQSRSQNFTLGGTFWQAKQAGNAASKLRQGFGGAFPSGVQGGASGGG